MSRFSSVRRDHVEFAFWLVFAEDGSVRLTRGEPSLARNERAMSLSATLPRSLWRTPALRASITMPEGAAPDRINIDIEAASEALKSVLGVDIDLTVREAGE